MAILKLVKTTGRKFTLTIIAIISVYITGVTKHFLSGLPADAMISGMVAIALGYFGINYAQKKRELENENGKCD
jgi:hypothetical protein